MIFNFDSKVAEMHGVNSAILIHNLGFWIKKNAANEKHFYNGNYWTYNSVKAFTEIFPFWTENTVRRMIEKLEEDGIILKGNYNESPYDRTSWYALSFSTLELLGYEEIINKCICDNAQIDLANLPNENGTSANCIIGTDNKPYNKTILENKNSKFYSELLNDEEWIGIICSQSGVQKSSINNWLEKFNLELAIAFDVKYSKKDYAGHFGRWLRIQLTGQKKDKVFSLVNEVPSNHPSRKKLG